MRNGSHISDPELDRLIVAQREELDTAKRKEIVVQIQRLIIDKAYNVALTAGIGKYAYPLTYKNVEPPPGTGESRWYADIWSDA